MTPFEATLIGILGNVLVFVLTTIRLNELKKLEAAHASDLAGLNARFKREGFAHDTRFDRLHKHVEVAVMELHPHIGRTVGAFESAVRLVRYEGEPAPEYQWSMANGALAEARNSLSRNAPFFPVWLLKDLNTVIVGMANALGALSDAFATPIPGAPGDSAALRVESRKTADAIFTGTVGPSLQRFYQTTRHVFGVDEVFGPEPPVMAKETQP